ncbi:MAG: hypothetical protein AAGE01_07635 [Pseudomonadota bacterium]
MNDWSRPEPFFRHFAWFLLAFVILSFLGKAILDTEDLPPITPLHHCHAVTMAHGSCCSPCSPRSCI